MSCTLLREQIILYITHHNQCNNDLIVNMYIDFIEILFTFLFVFAVALLISRFFLIHSSIEILMSISFVIVILLIVIMGKKERDLFNGISYDNTYAVRHTKYHISLLPMYENTTFFEDICKSQIDIDSIVMETIHQLKLYTIKMKTLSM